MVIRFYQVLFLIPIIALAAACERSPKPVAQGGPPKSPDAGAAAWGGGDAGATADKKADTAATAKVAMLGSWEKLPALDAKLAETGKKAFAARGCEACHGVGTGRKVGPDLAGVTARQDPQWVQEFILDPDTKLNADPYAKKLLETYLTRMPDQQATPEEARAIAEYLRGHDLGTKS